MATENILTEIREIIRKEAFIKELVGEEVFRTLSEYEREQSRLLDQLASILVEIFIAEEDEKARNEQ